MSVVNEHGYVMVKLPQDHPLIAMAKRDRYISEHRLVMAHKLSRLLKRSEHVHHLNHNKTDNRPENLILMDMLSHLEHHRIQLHDQWSLKYTKCITCGTTQVKHVSKGRCEHCFRKALYWENPMQKHRNPLNTSTMHYCIGCHQGLPVNQFYRKNAKCPTPVSRCKRCHVAYSMQKQRERRRRQ